MSNHPLEDILHPKSIAVVGASDTGRGGGFLTPLQEQRYQGKIYPVNPKYSNHRRITRLSQGQRHSGAGGLCHFLHPGPSGSGPGRGLRPKRRQRAPSFHRPVQRNRPERGRGSGKGDFKAGPELRYPDHRTQLHGGLLSQRENCL